jgi:hypothetical protein
MTNATKTLSVIFAISIALLLIQILLGETGESDIFRGDLVSTEPTDVNRITLNNPADTSFVELLKSDGVWQVHAENETFSADSQKINMALRELQNMEVEALVTRDPQKHTRYRVDSTGTTITLYNGDQVLDQVIASSSQFPGSTGDIYVRIPGENQVYSVSGLNRSSIQSNFNNWRDLTVWNVPLESISEIRFTYPADSSFAIQNANGTWMAGSDSLNQQKTTTLVSMVGRLNAAGYPPDEIDSSISSNPIYSVEFKTDNGESKTVNFYRFVEAEPAPFYLVTASGYPYTFTLPKRTWDQGVLLSREEYLQE